MVFSGLVQVIQDNLAGILGGGLTLTLAIKIIADAVTIKKLGRSMDVFGGSLGNNGKAILKIVNDFKDVVKEEVVKLVETNNVLVKELKEERLEKEFLQDILITTLSVANVPVAQRKEFHNAISKVSSISDVAKASLLASIEADEQKIVSSNVKIDNALELIENKEQQEGV